MSSSEKGEETTTQTTETTDVEASLLACLAKAARSERPDVMKKCMTIIRTSDVFAQKDNGMIYDAMASLFQRIETFDVTLLTEKLKELGKYETVDPEKLSGLFNSDSVNLDTAEEYARLVLKKCIRRVGVSCLQAVISDVSNPSKEPAEVLTKAKNSLACLIATGATEEAVLVGDLIDEVVGQIKSPNRELVPTGYEKLDELVGGVVPGEFIALAARASMGKTSLGLGAARRMASRGTPVAFVSLEMKKQQLTTNLLVIDSGVKSHVVRRLYEPNICDADWKKLEESQKRIKSYPILITDQIGRTSDIYANLSTLIARHGIKVAFIDYLGLVIPPKGNSLYEKVTTISREFKKMAKDLNIPLIVLAQLNRASELRDDKKPVMADLRDSGAIEQDADQVWLLHRPHYYDKKAEETEAELIVAKNRNGPTGNVHLVWHKQIMRFEDS